MSYDYIRTMNYYTGLFFFIIATLLAGRPGISLPFCGTPVSLEMEGDSTSSILLYNMHDNEILLLWQAGSLHENTAASISN